MKNKSLLSPVIGHRRFRCFSPMLIGIDYSPTGKFDDRDSLIVESAPEELAFDSVEVEGEWTVFKSSFLELRSRDHDRPATRKNLEIRWIQNGYLQFWRPGDRDNQNLGGTLRSLDRYGENPGVDGVHVADMEHPDAKGLDWLAWLQCETDPAYYKSSPAPHEKAGEGNYQSMAKNGAHQGRLLERTFNLAKDLILYSTGLLSRSGYFLLNDSEGTVLNASGEPEEREIPGYQKWYFFGYGHEYKKALQDFVNLCGKPSLPLRQCYGINFSRWPAWKEAEARELVQTFEAKGYPLSVLVLDMEWHREGWGHWDWDSEFYKDPQAFIAWLHERGMCVTLNDHPLMVRSDDSHFDDYVEAAGLADEVREREYNGKTVQAAPIDICNPKSAKAFLDICHKRFMEIGLDYWWNDGTSGLMDRTWGQLIGNRYFFKETEREGQRGMNMARYGGWGNHRYGLYFTGDALSCWDILRMQVEFNIRAGHVGMSNVTHDIGGFYISKNLLQTNSEGEWILDPLLYKRWLQFGVFNPVLRFHCAPGSGSRQPWDYETGPEGDDCGRWLKLRNQYLPYFYTAARQHVDTGIPMTRGHFLEDPENPDAYRFDQYMLGDHLLVAPVLGPENERGVYLPAGIWWEFASVIRHEGGQTLTRSFGENEIPVFVSAGSVIPAQQGTDLPKEAQVAELQLEVYAGADGEGELYEDDGRSPAYLQGTFARTHFKLSQAGNTLTLSGRLVEGTAFAAARDLVLVTALDSKVTGIRKDGENLEPSLATVRPDGRTGIPLGIVSTEAFVIELQLD